MYVLPYLRIVDSLVSYSLKWSAKNFMYVLPYLRIVDSLVSYSLKWSGKSSMYVLPYVINKGYFTKAFMFKPQGRRSPPSGLNRKRRKIPLFSL